MNEKEEFTRIRSDRDSGRVEMRRSKRNLSKLEKLFESDWEVLVVERDGQTGEFRARTSREFNLTD